MNQLEQRKMITTFDAAWKAVKALETRLREASLDNEVPYLFAQVEIAMMMAKHNGQNQNDAIIAAGAAVEKEFFPKK